MADAMKQQLDLFGAEVLDLKEFASQEATRFALTGIHLEPGRAVATNGKMMLIVPSVKADEWPGDVVEGLTPLPKDGVIVPVAALKKAFALVDRKSKIECLRGVVAGLGPKDSEHARVTLVGTDLETNGTVKARIVEGTYPDVDQVLPKPGSRPFKVVLSTDFLKSLVSYASKYVDSKDHEKGAIRFSFNPKDNNDSVQVDFHLADGRNVTGILMPIKAEVWCKDQPVEETKPAEPTVVVEEKPTPAPAPVPVAAGPTAVKKGRKGKKEAA